MAIEIRILLQGEEHVLANVAVDVFDDPIDLQSTALFLAQPQHHISVALDEGLVVGFASGVHYFHPDKRHPELFVNEVGVAPSHQGQGIGKKVLAALLDAGRAAGCNQAWVLTDTSNLPANKLYLSAGGEASTDELVMYTFPS